MVQTLIVEDNEKNRKLFKVIIESLGHKTLLAENGEECIKIAKEQKPNLKLMDIQMPVMDGLSAMKVLKSEERTRDIPIISLTSYAMKGDKKRLIEAGFIDYVTNVITSWSNLNNI